MSIQIFHLFLTGLFIFLSLYFKCSLCFLETRPLSGIRFGIIVFHSVGCHFTFSMIYSEAQKVFYFDEAQFIFTLVFGAFGVIPKKPMPNPRL